MELRLPTGEYFGDTVSHLTSPSVRVVESRLQPGATLPVHSHENAYVCVVLAGSFTERFGSRTRDCEPSTLKVHAAAEEHSEHFHSRGAHLLRIELTNRWAGSRAASEDLEPVFHRRGAEGVASLVHRLRQEIQSPDDLSPLVVEALTTEILVAVRRSGSTCSSVPGWLLRAREIVASAAGEGVTLDQLAGACGVHPNHLAVAYRKHFGFTVGEHLRRERVERATRMLADRRLSLSEIALAAGFADQSHFSRMFRRYVGTTPAEYRKHVPDS